MDITRTRCSGSRTYSREQSRIVPIHLCGFQPSESAPSTPVDQVAHLRQQRRRAGHGGVHVHPGAVLRRRRRRPPRPGRPRSCAAVPDRGDDGGGAPGPRSRVFCHGPAPGHRAASRTAHRVDVDDPQVLAPETGEQHGLRRRGMRSGPWCRRRAAARSPCRPPRVLGEAGRALAGPRASPRGCRSRRCPGSPRASSPRGRSARCNHATTTSSTSVSAGADCQVMPSAPIPLRREVPRAPRRARRSTGTTRRSAGSASA